MKICAVKILDINEDNFNKICLFIDQKKYAESRDLLIIKIEFEH